MGVVNGPGGVRAVLRWAATVALLATALPATAQQFHLYLLCSGKIEARGRSLPAHLDLALRDNNMTALVQRSNVLPVGERMRYEASPAFYSMKVLFANRERAFYDWWRGTLFIWQPDLQRLTEVRLSIDRQSAALEGELMDGSGDTLGRLRMSCVPQTNETVPEPKF